ncbi:ankyrin repeat, SAM and basic leucine zipper domain-containing protein 1 isoform X1 [Narcine bancroftii]|uniref:ankyrin repeat, SAM and basic leucine zipper domain-containing protein 1 isoform X1 n=1 Tax=Narcine bancroftii TaxID=1343680 RepID=UPI00383150D0
MAFVAAGAELEDSDDGWYLGCEGLEDMGITPVKAYEINSPRDNSSGFQLSKNEEGTSTLKEALSSQNTCLVEQILNSGVDVETRFGFGWTPLMYAASIANCEICRLLLDRGANASFVKDQYTVLMATCASSESEEKVMKCVELLLSRNADPHTASSQMTPLMYAAREGHTQTATLLLAQGVEINTQDDKGYTALIWASSQGHKSTALKLIDLGADKTLKTKCGETAADIAEKKHHSQLALLLKVTSNSTSKNLQNLTQAKTIFKTTNTGKSNSVSTSLDGIELFLYGLELEHLLELFKENDISLRGLLMMGKEDLEKIGITDSNDQQKISDAVCEMQPEDLQITQLSMLNNVDCSNEELTVFLIKLKKCCEHLIETIQNVTNQLASNSELRVLDLDPDKRSALICNDLVKCVLDLNKEVESLRNLLLMLQTNQERVPIRVPPAQNYFNHNQFLKKVAIGLFGTGFIFLLMKVNNMRN